MYQSFSMYIFKFIKSFFLIRIRHKLFSIDRNIFYFFFFSSRRRHTRYWRDWSSDVCSSDCSANTMRGFQGGRPSIYTLTEAIRKVPTPALIICGDEDDACVEPSLFLKKHLPAAGLTFFPKSGHVLNLEEPALFNEMVERFISLAEAGRWGPRDPRSILG